MNSGSETYIRNYLFFQWNRDNLINWIILNWIDRLFLLFVPFSRDTFACIRTNVTSPEMWLQNIQSLSREGSLSCHFLLYHGTSVEMVASENRPVSRLYRRQIWGTGDSNPHSENMLQLEDHRLYHRRIIVYRYVYDYIIVLTCTAALPENFFF